MKDEYYEMLQKISTHLVEYCPLTYFRDEIATVISWIWVDLVGIGKILPEIWFYGIGIGISYFTSNCRESSLFLVADAAIMSILLPLDSTIHLLNYFSFAK